MQRRLMLALVGIALSSVVLVGLGVLILAQVGARSQAEAEIDQRLQVASDYVAGTVNGDGRPRSVERLGRGLQLEELAVVAVDADGNVYDVGFAGPAPRGGPDLTGAVPDLTLDAEQFDRYLAGETVLIDDRDDDVTLVRGLRIVALAPARPGFDGTVGVTADKSVVTVGRQARIWFALAALCVVALSLVVAWWLARRLTRPILAIHAVTASVAAGDFSARVAVEGDDELADLGRAVNRMAGDLARSRALDQQFLMSVSHDLRTPLTAITGYAEALSDGATEDPAHAGRVIATHAGRLERLVGDLLDLAKLDANRFQFHLQPLDVAVTVGRTVAGLAPSAERYGLQLDMLPSPGLTIRADPDRLAQVVANLVDNALKFARTRIAVEVRAEGGEALVTVADDGPGIPDPDLPHVFERLYVSSAQPLRAENPSGMGLAIVRELTTAMGGHVAATTGPGGGTTMVLRLPLIGPGPDPVDGQRPGDVGHADDGGPSDERQGDDLDGHGVTLPGHHGGR